MIIMNICKKRQDHLKCGMDVIVAWDKDKPMSKGYITTCQRPEPCSYQKEVEVVGVDT